MKLLFSLIVVSMLFGCGFNSYAQIIGRNAVIEEMKTLNVVQDPNDKNSYVVCANDGSVWRVKVSEGKVWNKTMLFVPLN